jgi:large subunit ribosomal protein L19
MTNVIAQIEAKQKKRAVVDIRSGDTVRVHQKIVEGGKERVQIFEGLVIRASRKNSLTSSIAVRRIASGVGVEKTYLIHSPSILKIEVTKRSKVRRNYLSYMRNLTGKSARLSGMDFDKKAVNAIHDEDAEAEEAKLREQAEAEHEVEAAKKADEEAKTEAKVEAALASHETPPEPNEEAK